MTSKREVTERRERLLRTGALESLEAELRDALVVLPEDPVRSAALALTADDVRIRGWEAMCATAAVLCRRKPITAVGVDLTIHGDGQDAWGRQILYLETSYYADDCGLAFSTASPGAIREACGASTPAWSGGFVETDDAVTVEGVNGLHDAVERARVVGGDEADQAQPAVLGGWMRTLRVHQALARTLAREGLPGGVPLIVGAHDLPPYATAAYWSTVARDDAAAADAAAADAAVAAAAERERAHDAEITRTTIAEWTQRRETLRGWPWWVNRQARANHVGFARAHEAVQRMHHPELAGLPCSFEGTTADFAYLTALYSHLRHPDEPRPSPPHRPWQQRLFGR